MKQQSAESTPAFRAGADAPSAVNERQDQPLNEADAAMIAEFVAEAQSHIESAEANLLKLAQDAEDLEAVNTVFRGFHTIKGVAGFLNLEQIGELAHAAESLLELARTGKLKLEDGLLDLVLEALDGTKGLIGLVEDAIRSGRALQHESGLDDLLERLAAATQAAEAFNRPAGALPGRGPFSNAKARPGGNADATVKVSTDRLDALINTVGELVISQSQVAQDIGTSAIAANQRLARNLSQLGKITRALQDLSMAMRMVPIQGVFQKMARLVRDLARKADKNIEVIQTGADTELDRNVVEAISDPLVHMVRNAVDHGIENAAERAAAGKPPAGRISLRAFHQAGNVIVDISDDGRGLDRGRILQKAAAANLVRQGQDLSDREVCRLIFHPGLSTADKVSDLSGRGVGMDVVKRNVEALRGRVDIESVPGKGSRFTIRLPLTLAVIDGLVVKVGAQRYIIPISSIEQSFRLTAGQLSTVQGRGELCHVRGQLLPLVRLHRIFAVDGAIQDPLAGLTVSVQSGQGHCCLLVDELLGQQQVVIKSLGESMGAIPGISGGAILGDGNVSMIIDVPGLIDLATRSDDIAGGSAYRKTGSL
jgi:two-component system chemotaxis sensor kinase CheA